MSEQLFIVTHEGWDDYVFIGDQGQCEGEVYALINADEEDVPEKLHVWKAEPANFEICVRIHDGKVKTGE